MQTLLRRTPHSLPAPLRQNGARIPSRLQPSFIRTFADDPSNKETATREHVGSGRRPLVAVAFVLAVVPAYYFLHSGKPPSSENDKLTKARREGDPSKEYRDPRDNSAKTLEQKKARDGK